MQRNQKILVGLLVALALALAYRLTNPFEQETVERLTYARANKVTPPKSISESGSKLRIDLLQSPPKYKTITRRDLFRPPGTATSSEKTEMKPEGPAPKPPPKTERQKVEEHFRRFKAFGSYRHGDDIYIFLERGKQVLIVTRGDQIDGKYKITDLAEKSITITSKEISAPLKIDFDEL